MQRLPWQACPLEQWASADQIAWRTVSASWPIKKAKAAVRAYGQLLTFCGGVAPHRAHIEAFHGACVTHLQPEGAHGVVKHLAYALIALRPAEDWAWLIAANRVVLRQARGTPSPGTARRRGRAPDMRVPFQDWPAAHRERWTQGLLPPVAVADASPFARFKRGRGSGPAAAPALAATTPATQEKKSRGKRKPARHPSKWRKTSVEGAQRGWGRWLWWCANHDRNDPPETITLDRVGRYIDFHVGRRCAPNSVTKYLGDLLRAARVLFPEADWGWLAAEVAFLQDMAEPVKDKLAKLVPIEEIVRLGETLMDEAEHKPLSVWAATRYRDGLLIATLAWRPKRIANLGWVRMAENLRVDEAGDVIGFVFEQTKNGQPTEPPLPERLKPRYRLYLARYRKLLDLEGSDALWLSEHGKPLSMAQIGTMLRSRTEEAFGVAIGPHAFRHAFATSMGAADPSALPAVQAMLDHKDDRSNEPYEPLARSSYASRRLEEEGNDLLVPPPARRKIRTRRPKSTRCGPDPETRSESC